MQVMERPNWITVGNTGRATVCWSLVASPGDTAVGRRETGVTGQQGKEGKPPDWP